MAATGHEENQSSAFSVGDVVSIVRMQWMLVAACVVVGLVLAALYGALAPRKYRSAAVVHLATSAGQEIRSDRVVENDQFNRWNRQVFVKTQLDIMRSRDFLGEVLDRYEAAGLEAGLAHDEAGLLALGQMLDVRLRQATELLDIAVVSDDPDKSMYLANIVAEVFRDENLRAMTDSATSAKGWLDTQLVESEERIDLLASELRDFQRANDLADAEDKSAVSSAMDSLKLAYGDARSERVIHENMVRQHERLLRSGAIEELAKEMATPVIAQYMEAYATAATEQARIHARYGEKVAERIVADAEVARINAELRAEVQNTLEAERARLKLLIDKEKRLAEEIDSGKDDLLVRQGARVGYDRKKLEFDTVRENYGRLQARRAELELQAKTQLNNVRIVEEARAVNVPVSPSWSFALLAGALLGGVVGAAGAFLREWMDDTISSPLEVSTFLKVPFLGLIPKIENETDEIKLGTYTQDHPRSPVAEALRGLRTILEMAPDGPPKRLLVTSAVQEEGKTSTTVHLGVSFAKLDRRVVLIDCDLRRPRMHKVFGKSREIGLSTALHGEATVDEIIQETTIPGLSFIASGRGGDRPNELLASPALAKVLTELDSRFDLVVLDSPPSGILSDARILSKLTDGVVMIVREHAASRGLIREALSSLEQVGARIYGVAINAVDLNNGRKSYKYQYGYGYRYARYAYNYAERTDTAAK
jgi:capsular exopolysaccharide synthesis family protein